MHVRDERFGWLDGAGRAADVANAREDGGEVVRVECESVDSHQRGYDLTLGYRTHITDPLREDDIGGERADSRDVDLVHAAMVAQRRADGGIDFTTREAIEIGAGPREPRAISHTGRVIAAVRNPDESLFESQGADDFGRAGKQRDDSLGRN